MQEATVRRTLIVVLCLCGVVAMWVFADQAGKQRSAQEPPTRPAGSIQPASRTADPTADHESAAPGTGSDGNAQPARSNRQPSTVAGVHIISTTYNAITVGWDPVPDGGVAFYQVTLNGIAAGETGGNQLTINWFNDDTTSHFVQVWAYDNAGHRSPRGATVAVTRPAASSPTWPPKTSSGPGSGGQRKPTTSGRHTDHRGSDHKASSKSGKDKPADSRGPERDGGSTGSKPDPATEHSSSTDPADSSPSATDRPSPTASDSSGPSASPTPPASPSPETSPPKSDPPVTSPPDPPPSEESTPTDPGSPSPSAAPSESGHQRSRVHVRATDGSNVSSTASRLESSSPSSAPDAGHPR